MTYRHVNVAHINEYNGMPMLVSNEFKYRADDQDFFYQIRWQKHKKIRWEPWGLFEHVNCVKMLFPNSVPHLVQK
jgi:hypothetical protein